MKRQAKIFLSEERGVTQTTWFRSYNTFNFGSYQSEHKTAVEKLYVCNDDTLAGSKSFTMVVEESTIIILLPVAGAVEYKNNSGQTTLINSGQLFAVSLQKGETFSLTNPYDEDLVNFLQFWFKAGGTTAGTPQLLAFNIDEKKNALVNTQLASPQFYIAKFDGRKETVHITGKQNNCVFVFVVQGAFELEGILLHARDGVALYNYPQVEMEALSNDAVIILVEMV